MNQDSVVSVLRQIFSLIGSEKRARWAVLVAISVAVSLFEAVGALLVFMVLRVVTDPERTVDFPFLGDARSVFANLSDDGFLLVMVAVVGAYFLVRPALVIGQVYLLNRVAQNAGASIASRLALGYLRMPYAFHLTRNSTELIRNTHTSIQTLVNETFVPAVRLFAESILVLAFTFVLLTIAPLPTLLAFVVLGALLTILLFIIHPRIKVWGSVVQETSRATLKALQESLHGIRDIKILGREAFFERVFTRNYRQQSRARYLNATTSEIPRTILETGIILLILGLFSLMIFRGTAHAEVLSILGLFGYVAVRLQPSLQRISQGLNSLKFGAAAVANVHEDVVLIERAAAAQGMSESGADGPLGFKRELVAANLGFRYNESDDWVLREVNLGIIPGEAIGIAGPTGAGKTTLVDMLIGLLTPTEGSVTVDGVDVQTAPQAWQQNIGFVPQTLFLFDDTFRRNVALGLDDDHIDERLLWEAIEAAQLSQFVASLPNGLDTIVGERGVRLSGGQRQRVAIARALYRQPKVIVLDEGTSALDNKTEAEFMEAINRLKGGRTLIIVAHRLTTVQQCDRVIFLEAGRIMDVGAYDELLDRCAAFQVLHAASPPERI